VVASLSPQSSAEEIVSHLRAIGSEQNLAGMARFGINTRTALGISNAVLDPIARRVKRNHERALKLWQSDIREARLLAAFTDEPRKVTIVQCSLWADDLDSWEVVDTVSHLFAMTPFWRDRVEEFAEDKREFVRRAAFATLAYAAVHLKKEPDATFSSYLPLIERHAVDDRNFVRKAVNWALRQIGKRSMALHAPALGLARKLAAANGKSERWIGKDAVRELASEKTLGRLAAKTKPLT
jgi:3-methyladenine DNA glycosylase AlkD